jgi:hypothetical protein
MKIVNKNGCDYLNEIQNTYFKPEINEDFFGSCVVLKDALDFKV